MIYNGLYDLEGFLRINTLNDLKTKNFNLKENDIVFVVETLTFYKITNETTSNVELTETFSNLKATKYKTIVDYNEFINLLENEKNKNLSKNEELKQLLNEEKNKRENFKSEFNTFKQTNITDIINGNLYNTQQVAGGYTDNGGKQPPSYVKRGGVRFLMSNEYFDNNDQAYKDWIYMNTYSGDDAPQTTAFGISKNSGNDLHAYLMRSDNNNTSWQLKKEIWHTGNLKNISNYNGYYCFKNGNLGLISGWGNEINFDASASLIHFNWRTISSNINTFEFNGGGGNANSWATVKTGPIIATGDIRGTRVFNAVYNDYAEFFPKKKEIITEPGDIIALDENSNEEYYVKATSFHSVIVGVHSDEFGHLIGGKQPKENEDYLEINKDDFIPIGLAGRVKVKFKGIARKGMKVVPSNIDGVGRKYNPKLDSQDHIIGYVVEDNLNEEIKKVKIKIR